MAKVIIGIHGLANKPAREVQAKGWRQAISEGLEKNCGMKAPAFTLIDVYWADLLYKYPLHDDGNFSFDALFDDEPYIPAKPGALKQYEDGWTDWVRANAQSVLGSVADGVKKTFGMDKVADLLLEKALKDLHYYYDTDQKIAGRTGARREARIVLQEELEQVLLAHTGDEIMLIAHSMGTIIAYDVLRNLGRSNPDQGVRVPHFVTIGSPLGLPHVKLRVAEERTYDPKVRTPTIVTQSWLNFADRRDAVAFDTHLGDDYGPNATGIEVKDDIILNDYESNGKANHHKLFGYLRAPEVSAHIQKFLK